MLQRLIIITLCLVAPFYNVESVNPFYQGQTFSQENEKYFLHTVETGQTVYSIALMYHVSVEDIYRLNPESKDVIKIGESLKIPQQSTTYIYHTIQPKETLYSVSKKYDITGDEIIAANPGLSVETFLIDKIIRIPLYDIKEATPLTQKTQEEDFQEQVMTNSLLYPKYFGKDIDALHIALLLPFDADKKETETNAAGNRIVEYYEGFLLALDEMKKQGVNVKLEVYDTGSDTKKIPNILKKESVQNLNLIIGGQSEEQIALLSKFSQEKEIPYIIPFTSRSNEPVNNYFSFQINTPQPHLYTKAAKAFYEKYTDANIIFFSPSSDGNKADFTNTLKTLLDTKNVTYKTVSNIGNLKSILDGNKRNVFVAGDDNIETLNKMTTAMKVFLDNNPNYHISLFGHPRWQEFSIEKMEDFFHLNACFYSTFYSNPTYDRVKNFHRKYTRWYSRELINRLPKYGMLGYDTGMYFMQLLSKYGTAFNTHINDIKYEGVQTDFYFERINNWSGYFNTNIFLVEYNTDYTVTSASCK
jgi:Predicted glycosyl hydrolase